MRFAAGAAVAGMLAIGAADLFAELTDRGAPKGRQFSFTMDSTKSVIFDGSDPTLSPSKPRLLTRQIWVYVPAKYVDGTAAPILVIQDGPGPLTEISRALAPYYAKSGDHQRQVASLLVQLSSVQDKDEQKGLLTLLEPRARLWNYWVSVLFLKTYLEAAGGAPFLPSDQAETSLLLYIFYLEKAIFELEYELANRPDRVPIALKGILRALEVNA